MPGIEMSQRGEMPLALTPRDRRGGRSGPEFIDVRTGQRKPGELLLVVGERTADASCAQPHEAAALAPPWARDLR